MDAEIPLSFLWKRGVVRRNVHKGKRMKDSVRAAFRCVLYLLPLVLVAGFSMAFYTMGTGLADGTGLSRNTLIAVVMAQTFVYAMFCAFFGRIMSGKLGLWKGSDGWTGGFLPGTACGLIFFLFEHFWFSRAIPQVGDFYASYPFSLSYLASEVFYGGVVEELLLRLFLMSLLALLGWKLFQRKRETASVGILIVANVVSAFLFALGHIPATIQLYGTLTPLLVFRCFLLNGTFGLCFGWLYRKKGIASSMVAHGVTHVVCDLLFFFFG